MREGLEGEGYAVLCAASGTEGLELARAKKPDLVLTDLMMPGMDGLVFLKTLKKLDPFLPVVIITGQVRWRPPSRPSRRVPPTTSQSPCV